MTIFSTTAIFFITVLWLLFALFAAFSHVIILYNAMLYIGRDKHYNDVIMGAMASQITSLINVYSTISGADQRNGPTAAYTHACQFFFQITSLTIVYLTVYSDTDERKHQSSASLAFCVGNSPVTGKFPAQKANNAEHVPIWWHHYGGKLGCLNHFLVAQIILI